MKKSATKTTGAAASGGGKVKSKAIDKSTIQKTRVKEGKELSKLYEGIAKSVVSKELTKMENKIHLYVGELLSKSLSEYRHDVLMMESSISARLSHMESKLSESTAKIDVIQAQCQSMNTQFQGDVLKLTNNLESVVDAEQQKRLDLYKKLQSRDEKKKGEFKDMLAVIKEENVKSVTSLNEDIKVQSQEINRLRDNLDEMLMRRHGFVPAPPRPPSKDSVNNGSSAPVANFNQGMDANYMLESLTTRMQGLETQLRQEIDGDDSISEPVSIKKRMDSVEKQLNSLRRHVLDCEEDIRDIKSGKRGGGGAGGKKGIAVEDEEEIKSLQRKLKRLAENTTRACKSLSGGLSDVQQATLNLYAWSDKAHDSFGIISEKMGFVGNLCPRAKVNNPKAYDSML